MVSSKTDLHSSGSGSGSMGPRSGKLPPVWTGGALPVPPLLLPERETEPRPAATPLPVSSADAEQPSAGSSTRNVRARATERAASDGQRMREGYHGTGTRQCQREKP